LWLGSTLRKKVLAQKRIKTSQDRRAKAAPSAGVRIVNDHKKNQIRNSGKEKRDKGTGRIRTS